MRTSAVFKTGKCITEPLVNTLWRKDLKGNKTINDKKGFQLRNIFKEKTLTLTSEAWWVLVGLVGTGIATLLGIKLLTNVLGPFEFGKLALANTVVAFSSTNFLFGPLGQGIMRFWSISRDRGKLEIFYSLTDRYARYAIYITILLTAILSIILGIIQGFDSTHLLTISLIVGATTGWLGLRMSVFTAMRQRKRVALLNTASAFLWPIIASLIVILIKSNASCAMVGQFLATFIVVLIAERFYHRNVPEASFSVYAKSIPLFQGLGKEMLLFSLPFFVWGIFNWIHMSCDRWSLQTFYSADVVGAFAVVSLLATQPLNFGSRFLSALFTPIAYQQTGDPNNFPFAISPYSKRILIVMISIYIMGAIILIAIFASFHRHLVLLISNNRFAIFSSLLPGLTIAWSLFYLGQLLSSFGFVANRPRHYIMPKLISSLVAGTTTFFLLSRIGPIGVVWGLGLAGFIYGLWCGVIAWKLMHGIKC